MPELAWPSGGMADLARCTACKAFCDLFAAEEVPVGAVDPPPVVPVIDAGALPPVNVNART